jgi:hypothetical protein
MAAPDNYVLTVYLTEAAAKVGDTATALAVDDDGKILQSGQAAGYGFWTHTKYYYRIEANEPVKEFYIDWDDGEDNDPKAKANYTTIKLDTPVFVGITSHIYTGNSTIAGGYFPKIRCKSIEGFWSKFYQNRAATPASTPISTGIDILQGETALTAGRNDKYRVESDNTTERIPALYPTIKPPVAILKSDRKRVYAGIDNGFLRGDDGDLDGETVTLIEVPNSSAAVRTGVNVEVTYTTTGLDGGTAGNRGDVIQTSLNTSDIGTSDTISNVTKILKVELLSLLEDSVAFNGSSPSITKLFPGEKMVLVAGSYSDEKQQTLAEVSLGNPIVVLDEPRHTVTYDLTESFARTSEQSISNYYLDDGKFKMGSGYAADAYIQQVGNTNSTQNRAANSDIFYDLRGILEISSGVAKRSYIFDVGYNYVDSDHRWLPKQILARGQIKTNNPSGMTTAKRDQQYSYLEHWVNESHTRNYSDVVDESVAGYNWPSDVTSSALLGFKGAQDLDRWVDLEDRNRLIGDDTNFIMKSGGDAARDLSGLYDFDHDNATSLDDVDNTAMLICARDSKWTKQFFKLCHDNAIDDANTSPQGKADKAIPGSTADGAGVGTDGVGHMKTRVQALYTGYENDKSASPMWKPLKLLNKTKHPDYEDSTWYADGSFEWEEPEDWASLDPETIPDKFWPRGDYFTTGDANSWASSDDIYVSGAVQEIATIEVGLNFLVTNFTGASYPSTPSYPNNEISIADSTVRGNSSFTSLADGLSWIRDGRVEDIVGTYFTFTSNEAAGDENYYVWFKQAATNERLSIRVKGYDSNAGSNSAFVLQPGGAGTQLYGRGFILTSNAGTEYGFWVDPGGGGAYSHSGWNDVVLPYWDYGSYGADTPDNEYAVDTSAVTGGDSSGNLALIASAIANRIDGITAVFDCTMVTANSNYYLDIDFNVAGVVGLPDSLSYHGGKKGGGGVNGTSSFPAYPGRALYSTVSNTITEANNGGGSTTIIPFGNYINSNDIWNEARIRMPLTENVAVGATYTFKTARDMTFVATAGSSTSSGSSYNFAPTFDVDGETTAQCATNLATVINALAYFTAAVITDAGLQTVVITRKDPWFEYTSSRSYDGKDEGTTPAAAPSAADFITELSGKTEISVPYNDGDLSTTITDNIITAINDKSGCDVTADELDSRTVRLTQDLAGDIVDAAEAIDQPSGGRTGFRFTTTTAGVEIAYAGDWFEDGDKWNATNKKYAIMFLIETDSGAAGTSDSYKHMNVQHTWPCSNAHSVLVDLIDPMCVSLNTFSIVQSISFVHKGQYQMVKDRLGKTDIRKIGSTGGTMKFGGIDLSSETTRAKFYEYQSQATPVFLDVEHRNGDFSRFFGVLTDMSEDHPTGKVIPKFAVTMEVSHMITMDSGGIILSDGYISLGGNIDEPSYL